MADITTCTDADDLADRAADWLVDAIAATPGRAAICLSGGSTPKRLYQRLARDPWRARLPWPRLHWFFGDERVVPADDPRSNQHMAREALLDQAPVPPDQVHAVPVAGLDPEAAAAAYQAALEHYYGGPALDPQRPLFDVMLLGIGPDGHTASLFPGSPALRETRRWAVAGPPGLEPFVPRVTLTFPALAASRATAFLVSGADKRAILPRVLAGEDLPAARAATVPGVRWFADKAALGEA
ncbi:6-phosphogluconolactonase [Labrys wisconsinensis]|uniref:6-phosphogluconolactonase n=1 Tax=Labrys wisconsinensis TaxID=425677 RepID=A0ABU0J4J2_9HYPH|nr:6-phosphogluconolactonase [Labrys wisconsinensis]MDQ0469191.1 6-phosphogluconolactonase [Labrys wisconsinensis]